MCIHFLASPVYRGANKSLVRPWKETSYSDQELQHYTNKQQQYIAAVCTP